MLARGVVVALLVAWAKAETLTPAQVNAISQCVNGLPITDRLYGYRSVLH
jgi:hypothetical protein